MNQALKRRVAPSVPLRLDASDGNFSLALRLCFDFNAIALIEEHTGMLVIGGKEKSVWNHLTSARVVSVMLWATCLAHSPEYDSAEGLAVIRSYMDPGNLPQIAAALDEAFICSLPADRQAAIRATQAKDKEKKAPTPVTVIPDPA